MKEVTDPYTLWEHNGGLVKFCPLCNHFPQTWSYFGWDMQQTCTTPLLKFEKVLQMSYSISKVLTNSNFGRGVVLKCYWRLVKEVEKEVIKGQNSNGCHYFLIGFRGLKIGFGYLKDLHFVTVNTWNV